MMEATQAFELRVQLFGKQALNGEPAALGRLRALPRFRSVSDAALRDAGAQLSTDDLRTVIAREFGFTGPQHAQRVLSGEDADDYGALLYGGTFEAAGTVNHWFAQHDEAKTIHAQRGGYLLAYKRHFVIVTRDFIERLGLDPDDPDWTAMRCDWTCRGAVEPRRRLYAKLFAAMPAADAGS